MGWPSGGQVQTFVEKENDARAWFNLVRPDHERKTLIKHTEMMCCRLMGNGELCHAWGSHVHGGRRYCPHRAPSESVRA